LKLNISTNWESSFDSNISTDFSPQIAKHHDPLTTQTTNTQHLPLLPAISHAKSSQNKQKFNQTNKSQQLKSISDDRKWRENRKFPSPNTVENTAEEKERERERERRRENSSRAEKSAKIDKISVIVPTKVTTTCVFLCFLQQKALIEMCFSPTTERSGT
jgi:hypothetical protein